jgi:predicted nucleic acid-binding Zn ribbon protein
LETFLLGEMVKAEVCVTVGTCHLVHCNGAAITQGDLVASDRCQEVLHLNTREEGDVNTLSSSVEVGPPE